MTSGLPLIAKQMKVTSPVQFIWFDKLVLLSALLTIKVHLILFLLSVVLSIMLEVGVEFNMGPSSSI